MSYQAVEWALYRSPMLYTEAGKPDTTARQVLAVLAEHADERGASARPGNLRIRFATGFDERTIQRAQLRLERAGLIVRDGVDRFGVTRWRLVLSMVRPESEWTELEAEAEKARRLESDRRAARRDKAAAARPATVTDADVSGTQNPGQHADGSMCPGRRIPASGTQNPAVRDLEARRPGRSAPRTTQEPPGNHPGTTLGGSAAPKPPRPQDPTPSDPGTENHRSISTGQDPPLGLVGDHRPRADTPPPDEHASTDRTKFRLAADQADEPPDPGRPITAAAAAALKELGEPIPRCDHGMYDVVRRDGQHCCPACRRGLPAEPPPATQPPALSEPRSGPQPSSQPGKVLPFRRPSRSRKEPA